MSVNISHGGALCRYAVTAGMLVQDLIEEISERQDLSSFSLELGELELLPDKFVAKYLVTGFMMARGDTQQDTQQVAVEINAVSLDVRIEKPDSGRILVETASPAMTLGQLIAKICSKLSSTQAGWVVKKNGEAIPDVELLRDHLGETTFTVLIKDMKVIVKFNGSSIVIETTYETTIGEFMALGCGKLGRGFNYFNLVFNEDFVDTTDKQTRSRTLGSYHIENNSVINTVASLHVEQYLSNSSFSRGTLF